MADSARAIEAKRLIQQGAADERIESATGLTLVEIIAVRASAAVTPSPLARLSKRAREAGS